MTIFTLDELPTGFIDAEPGSGFYMFSSLQQGHTTYPASHIEDANKLTADAKIDLFCIVLLDKVTKLFLKQDDTRTWQGDSYEGTAIKVSGVAQYADDQSSRPSLMLYNPRGVFNTFIDQGLVEGATVIRYRLLKAHLDADLPIYQRQKWKVSRIASMRGNALALELRDMLDGQIIITPARMYMPPDFPVMSLT